MNTFTIAAGQTRVLTAVFADGNGKTWPLFSQPTAVDPNGLITFAPLGDQTLDGGPYKWNITCPAGVADGTDITLNVQAEGDPTPGKNTLKATITGVVGEQQGQGQNTGLTLSVGDS